MAETKAKTMENKEAIEYLLFMKHNVKESSKQDKALDLAITALEEWGKLRMICANEGIYVFKEAIPAETEPKDQTAPAGHSKEEIRAKYHELIQFCSENNLDLNSVCKEFSLNAKSSYEEFEIALRKLIYITSKKEATKLMPEYSEEV